jgi:hypothetical protein
VTDHPPTEKLADATAKLRAGFRMIPLDETTLKSAVCEFVDETRVLGWPVERIITTVKRVAEVEDGAIYSGLVSDVDSRTEARRLISRLVTYCVERYYAAV